MRHILQIGRNKLGITGSQQNCR